MVKYAGKCQCGAVGYEAKSEPSFVIHCECLDCKKSSGAGHATWAAFETAAVQFSGVMSRHSTIADRGGTTTREFCPTCGGRMALSYSSLSGHVLVAAGTLDDPDSIIPSLVLYNKRHTVWDHVAASLATYPAMPPRTYSEWAKSRLDEACVFASGNDTL